MRGQALGSELEALQVVIAGRHRVGIQGDLFFRGCRAIRFAEYAVHPKDFLEDLIFHVEQVVEVVEQLLQDQPLTHLMEVVQEEMVLQLQFQDLQQLMLEGVVGPVIFLLVLLED